MLGKEGFKYENFAIPNTSGLKLPWEFYIFVLTKKKKLQNIKKYLNSYDYN